ncbi:hypothetical protein SPF06_18655 [Sinomonas sp. JGH33]|uniref:Uncharacterized protein n=1 Tax=Sinomonas terricola TaxID=3110330 RepID=A0ABU5TB81_9MICC|nr:hypothetical protein [Sinomonas sp. JGH33]MEA5456749.1 hypothetical protein [Sinomonas sp. JGH33]
MKKITHREPLATPHPAFTAGPLDIGHRSMPPNRRLMAFMVDCSARECAAQVAEAQSTEAAGKLARAFRTWPAEAIAALLDDGHQDWARAFFPAFVRYLHQAERRVALEAISAEAALAAITEPVRKLTGPSWDEVRYALAAEIGLVKAAAAV